jgi:hypothetical protein
MQNPVFADILDQDGKVRKDRHAADYSMEEVVPSEALVSIAVLLKSRHEKKNRSHHWGAKSGSPKKDIVLLSAQIPLMTSPANADKA